MKRGDAKHALLTKLSRIVEKMRASQMAAAMKYQSLITTGCAKRVRARFDESESEFGVSYE